MARLTRIGSVGVGIILAIHPGPSWDGSRAQAQNTDISPPVPPAASPVPPPPPTSAPTPTPRRQAAPPSANPIPTPTPTPAPLGEEETLSQRLLERIASEPLVAPYATGLRTFERGAQVVIEGTLGSRSAYDAAIRAALDSRIPFRDQLRIDTSLSYLGAEAGVDLGSTPQPPPALTPVAPLRSGIGRRGIAFSSPFASFSFSTGRSIYSPYRGAYPYPPPWVASSPNLLPTPYWNWLGPSILGPDADLLYTDPPIISYPPDWPERSASRLRRAEAEAAQGQPQPPNPAQAPADTDAAAAAPAQGNNAGPTTWQMRMQGQGVAVLSGKVSTRAEKIAISESVAKLPGVRVVINNLDVEAAAVPEDVGNPAPAANPDPNDPIVVPPPPNPNAAPPQAPEQPPAAKAESEPLSELGVRIRDEVNQLPEAARLGSRFRENDGTVTLTGNVPSAYEAMLLFRAVQKTPGVQAVHDQLRVRAPGIGDDNPLKVKAKPEDAEPYLEAQLRRHLGSLARVDLVRLNGDSLSIQGSARDEERRQRAEAVLRSIPLLRGFRLDAEFAVAP